MKFTCKTFFLPTVFLTTFLKSVKIFLLLHNLLKFYLCILKLKRNIINIISNLVLSNVVQFFSTFLLFSIFLRISENLEGTILKLWILQFNSAMEHNLRKIKKLYIEKYILLIMMWALLFMSLQVGYCKIHEINISWLCQVGLILQVLWEPVGIQN